MQQVIALTTTLSFPAMDSYYLAKYSNTILIMVTTAIQNEPNATDPIWFQSPHLRALRRLTSPGESDMAAPCPEKYHMQQRQAIMNCCMQMTKATLQRSPNRYPHMMYSVCLPHLILAKNYPGLYSASPTV